MAKLAMKKIEIVALKNDRKKIIELLQRRGVIEVLEDQNEALFKLKTAENVSQFEKNITVAEQAKSILEQAAPQKKSLLESFSDRREMEKSDFKKMAEQKDYHFKMCHDLVNCQKKIADCKAAIVRTETLSEGLKIWLGLPIAMQFGGTKNTRAYIGTIPNQRTAEDILGEIAAANPALELLDISVISSFKEQTCIMAVCHSDIAKEVFTALRDMGFVQPSDPTKHPPSFRMARYQKELLELHKEIEDMTEKIKSYAGHMAEIEFLTDYLTLRRDKYIALSKIGLTKTAFVVTGFLPEKYADTLIKELEEKFSVAVQVAEPLEDEDVPVLLQNNGFSSPVEAITEMYALPTKRDVDPSSVMAFFYYLFFGMMLSDAGYGLIMVLVSALLLKKVKLKESMKKTFKMFLFCGISTVFWGALFGSWFGDIIQVVANQFFGQNLKTIAVWFDPIQDPMTLLLLAFVLGIVHLFVGLGVNFLLLWKEGRKMDAILDVIPVYMMVLGAAPLAASILVSIPSIFSFVGQYLALAGVVIIVLTSSRSSKNIFARLGGGLYGLYNIASGYLSDVLSYSRLLALGLATGSIAGVVNLMGSMSENLVVKAVVLSIVFVIGHTLNIAINLLGAYVHTNRLQFVEFFSKFYEGGGRAFDPLKVNTKYIQFKEDISNG